MKPNAPNPSPEPYALTAYAAQSHPNCRPRDRLPAKPAKPAKPTTLLASAADPEIEARVPMADQTTTPPASHNAPLCGLRSGFVDLEAVRTFVAAADAGQFSEAAADMSVTQQAVSKRIAALEKDLGVRLFTRTARGARLTVDGQAFLPHARDLLQAERRAAASVRPGRRALRVDVIDRKLAPADLLRGFHREHPSTELDVVTLFDADAAIEAVRTGTIDASFRAVTLPARQLPQGIRTVWVLDEAVQLLTGPAHQYADAGVITPAQLAGCKIWMPGIVPGTEWAAYYDDLAAAFGLSIEVSGPGFGTEPLLDTVAASADLATFVGDRTRLIWPAGWDLRRIAMRDPVPVYPHSLIWRADNRHPVLAALRSYLRAAQPSQPAAGTWRPRWAQRA
jgi:DNA-binding transcriptional LysR family regulator